MEQQLAHTLDDAAGRVLDAHAAAAGEDHGVAVPRCVLHFPAQKRLVVHHDAVTHRLRAECFQHGGEQRGIHIPHLAGSRRLVGRHQLVPGGDHAHLHPACHGHAYSSDGGQRADILGRQHPSGGEDLLAGEHVVPPEDQIHPRRAGLHDADGAVSVVFGVFEHHRTVGALGDRAAGGHIDAAVAGKREVCPLSHQHLPGQVQDRRDRVGTAEGIGCPAGVAIHSGAVEVRDIFLRRDRLGQHPAQRSRKGDGLRLPQRLEFLLDQPEDLLRRLHLKHLYTSATILPISR